MRVSTTHLPWIGMKFDELKLDFTQSRKIPSMSPMVFLSGAYPISPFMETTSLNSHNIPVINRITPLESWIFIMPRQGLPSTTWSASESDQWGMRMKNRYYFSKYVFSVLESNTVPEITKTGQSV